MFNRKLLKEFVTENGDNWGALAKALHISPQWMSHKLQSADGGDFTLQEVEIIRQRYELSDEDIIDIFFAENM